jgi:hypothetical protein
MIKNNLWITLSKVTTTYDIFNLWHPKPPKSVEGGGPEVLGDERTDLGEPQELGD